MTNWHPRLHRRGRLIVACLVWAVVVCSPSATLLAQAVEIQPVENIDAPARGFANLHADAVHSDVYVNDSFEAADVLARAATLTRQGEWTDAAILLQETSDSARDKLVRVAGGYYVGVRGRINDVIAAWPPDGLSAYRLLHEHKIEDALATRWDRRDLLGLFDLFDRYFCTSAAAKLADTIGQLAMETGNLQLAEHVYQRVLTDHSDRKLYEPSYGVMLQLVRAMRGEPEPPAGEVAPDRTIRWMGKDRSAGKVLADIGQQFRAVRAAPSAAEWPIYAGGPNRNRTTATQVDELGLLWQYSTGEVLDRQSRTGDEGESVGRAGQRARHITTYPVVGANLVFIQHARKIVALHRQTGAVAWRFHDTTGEATAQGFREEQMSEWDSVTLRDGRIYASLPGDPVPFYSFESAGHPTELVCLDAVTGRVIWRLDQLTIEEQFAEISFDSSPLVQAGYLFITGRRHRSFGFEDCYLYCFDAQTGAVVYRTHLGSASTGTYGSRRSTKAVVAAHRDMVFVCTNLGTVAAVSTHTGAVRWLRLYERRRDDDGDSAVSSRDARSWHVNPVMISDARLVVLPTDGARVLVLDRDDGRLEQSIRVENLAEMRTLLGVRGDLLCGMGENVTCYDLADEELVWSTPLPQGEPPFGRGVWAGEELLVPTRAQLSVFNVSHGRRSDTVWDAEGRGGNLIALPDQIFVAGAGRVSVYVRKREIRSALHDRMAAAPNDPLPALELAEVALNSGESSEAMAMLDEAVRRAKNLPSQPEPELASRLFDAVLMFVDRLSARSSLDIDLINRLFEYASLYTPDAAAHVRYRLRFAHLFEEYDRGAHAVRLYHQILRDRSLRDLPADPNAAPTDTAGSVAEIRIAALIGELGRAIYEPLEAEARQWLQNAKNTGEESLFDRLVTTFPNSEAAPLALLEHANRLAGQAKPTEAAARFARALHRYPEQVDRPDTLRRIADAYASAGMDVHAYRWLTKAAREFPALRFDDQGRTATFAEYRQRLSHVREQVEPSRPDLRPPLGQHTTQETQETGGLLSPRFGDQPLSSWSRYFIHAPNILQAFDAATGGSLWASPASVQGVPELLLATPDVALFATRFEVFALDTVTGTRRWSDGDVPPLVDDPLADWEDADDFRTHVVRDGLLVSVRADGVFTCRRIDSGEVLWTRTHRPTPVGRVQLTDPWVMYHVVQDGSPVICLVDAATGAWYGAIMTDETRSVERVFATLDGRIVVATSESISSYDPQTRKQRWRIPLRGFLRRTSLQLDVDTLCFSEDGRGVVKISLEDGRRLWESEPLAPRGDADFNVALQGGSVIVASSSAIAAIDAVTGLTLWQGTTPEHPRFLSHIITDAYVVALDFRQQADETHGVAYFYDHRNASGAIARDGGAPRLDPLSNVRAVMAFDGALLIQTETALEVWRQR